MKRETILLATLLICFSLAAICHGEQTVVARKVDHPPRIDGVGDDPAWKKVESIATHDRIEDMDVVLKAVYTDDGVFFLAVFPDPDESRVHKVWIWDKDSAMYKIGPERGDCFIFKWNMEASRVDLSLYGDEPYLADIWFWKAGRTDPRGFADDKIQQLSSTRMKKSRKLTSKSGLATYLRRTGDKGDPAYMSTLHIEYKGDRAPPYIHRSPTGSRADVRARGVWRDGEWTVEFGRKLNTGHRDDVRFEVGKTYQFGVSRNEIAGRRPDPSLSHPRYGAGDISEVLLLEFKP